MDAGNKIKELRKMKGITQKELSSLSGVAEISIRQYENNKRQPKVEQLQKIAKAFDLPIGYFLSAEEDAETKNETLGDAILKIIIGADRKDLEKYSKLLNMSVTELISKSTIQGLEVMLAEAVGREPQIIIRELQEYINRIGAVTGNAEPLEEAGGDDSHPLSAL